MAHLENDLQSKELINKKLTKRLIQALVLSIVFNIGLFVFCLYEWQEVGYSILRNATFRPRDKKTKPSPLLTEANRTITDELVSLKEKSADELISLLADTHIVYDGYTMRDLALTALVSYQHFNYQKPLSGTLAPKQERAVKVDDKTLILFAGLSSEQFSALEHYAKEERYPFTTEGLFYKLKQNAQKESNEEGLKEAFALTQEYLLVDTLLSRGCRVSVDDVIDLLVLGDWKTISQFADEEKKAQDFTPEKRRKFLLSYIELSSKKAAELLVQVDREYAVHKLDDSHVIIMLSLLEDNPTLCKDYAVALLESPRKDQVWSYAQAILSHVCQKEELAKCTRAELLQYFGLKKPAEVVAMQVEAARKNVTPTTTTAKAKVEATTAKATKTQAAPAKKSQTIVIKPSKKPTKYINYTVQTGDNLWKIAKKFKIEIHAIMIANNLKSDALKPGAVLRIPY
jgi:LysM repeat protein